MTASERRLAANQKNAAFSTGPRTVQGKMVSRNNALRHGLARPVTSDPVAANEVEALTGLLAGSRNDFWCRELAQELAASFCDLRRIDQVRCQILQGLGDLENADRSQHEQAAKQMERIRRYEQRAFARHRKALCAFYDANE